jgi:hypothetical protein
VFWHTIVLPAFFRLQSIAGKRLGSFSIAAKKFLDDVVILMMRGTKILFFAAAFIGEMIAAWSWRAIRLIDGVSISKPFSLVSKAGGSSKVIDFNQDNLIVFLVGFIAGLYDGA